MRYLSVCSGIEAASVAWEPLGWRPVGFSEIDKFPSEVLAKRFPDVQNFGDMTKYKEWNLARDTVDVIVGGTPCQSFSVAGLRKGLDDPRGNLALTFVSMVEFYQPEWVIWENVPGVLSSSGGRDFGAFLGALGQLRYGFAYRVLDAQYFGVPQRRRRVIVVGHSSGDARRASEVLFEPESLRGDTKASRAKGKAIAQCLTTGTGCKYDPERETLIPVMYNHHPNDSRVSGPVDVSPTVVARWGTGGGNTPLVQQTYRKSSRATCQDGLETWVDDGIANTLNCFDIGDIRSTNIAIQPITFQPGNLRRQAGANPSFTTTATLKGSGGDQTPHVAIRIQDCKPIALAENTIGRQPLNGGNGNGFTVGGPMYTLNATGVHGIAHTLTQDQHLMHGMAVRRLTPVECERLQGFPDGWTDILSVTPDGSRYKAIGNSMAVPVMAWLGKRIQESKENHG